jgi:hypothetical protein
VRSDLVHLICLLALPATLTANTNTGRVTGFVRLVGPTPTVSNVAVAVDLAVCGSQARPLQSLSLGTNQAVQGAVIWLDLPATESPPRGVATLDQSHCEFIPRVQIAQAGAPLLLRNSDPTLHVVEVVTNGGAAWWRVAAPYTGFVATNQLPATRAPLWLRAGNRNGHDWMTAFIVVMPHPWAVLSGETGAFYFRAVPAGNHTLRVWHEVLGESSVPVTVRPGTTTRVILELPPRNR